MPIYQPTNPRRDAINALIERSLTNPLIDDASVASLFDFCAAEVMTFERTGTDLITPKLQNQIDTDGPHKAFLLSYTDEGETTTVMDAITEAIANA